MIVINQVKTEIIFKNQTFNNVSEMIDNKEYLKQKVSKLLKINIHEIKSIEILKHSIDARKKPQIFQVYTLGVCLLDKIQEDKIVKRCKNSNISCTAAVNYQFPKPGTQSMIRRPVIIGMGPAGIFCAYMLAIHGYRPIVLERGKDVIERTKDVEDYWNGASLNTESNVQFGEGGAGTFSDGKLNTLIKDKFGRNKEVLKIFVSAGAPKEILYEAKPHIGTDILKKVVIAMRKAIIEHGGEVRFKSRVSEIEVENGNIKALIINETERLEANQVVLAIGHSARDTFAMLYEKQVPMEAKSFAVGMRVEHPQQFINEAMYGKEHGTQLPPVSYKLTAKTSMERGVYSFCMCPGGYVVNASSENRRLAVNGMSYSDRGSCNANSAIIVAVTPKDFPGTGPLAGIEFQRDLEEKAYALGSGKIPVQYYDDFLLNQSSAAGQALKPERNKPCIKGEYIFTNLRGILPEQCEQAFIEGMKHFDSVIKGYACKDTIISGIESRTSSPVRIERDETLQCPVIRGLYPCGEGAGYAGGITSAAMDGIVIAEKIASEFMPFDI